jgi:peptidoglycan hydrolase-like protein with peptidoglycan-binding domain
MNRYILILFLLVNNIVIFPKVTEAHPGNTASDGKHYCWSNCSYWGQTYGVRHGHGNYSGSVSPTYKTKSSSYSSATYNLQKQLNSVIGSQLTTDGRRGPKTTQAIKMFQKKYGLVQDGIDGLVTKARLQELYDEYLQAQKNKEDKPLELKHINKGYKKDPEKFDACFNQKKSFKYCTDLVLEGRELDEVEIKEKKNIDNTTRFSNYAGA